MLPIEPYLPSIVRTLGEARQAVLVAEPGAGKTTRVPPAVLAAKLLPPAHPRLVMLQPRRIAARAAAQRIAEENGWRVGEEVGYHVRFERRLHADTRLAVLTEGILTRQLVDDPFLDGVGGVILDEFHERSIHTDLALALLKEIRETVRRDLLLVVMSATLDAGPIAKFLGEAPVINVPGRTHPVALSYMPPGDRRLDEHIARVVTHEATGAGGDVLVFLPGAEEIRRVQRRLPPANAAIVPLYGALPLEEQQRALRPDPAGRRKIILATNIAETSLTIEGVRTVIDSGLARVAGYDAARGLDRLELQRISQASATQRAGRAGRTAPGRCIRLWSEAQQKHLRPFDIPEIRRVDLASTVLTLHAWGRSGARGFRWFEPPAEEMLAAGERLLELLGALGPGQELTRLGREIFAVPAHPRIGALLVAAARAGHAMEGAAIAALLSEKDILKRAAPHQRSAHTQAASDVLLRLHVLAQVEQSSFAASWRDIVDLHAARAVVRTRRDLQRIAERMQPGAPAGHADDEALLRLVWQAYPDRVVRRRANDPYAGVMVGGKGVMLAKDSAVIAPELYVAVDARSDPRAPAQQATITIASAVDRAWLPTRSAKAAEYDAPRDRVVGVTRTMYQDLVLDEQRHGTVNDAAAAQVLTPLVRQRAVELVRADEQAARLLARVALLRDAVPERPWPTFTEDQLAETLAELVPGKRSLGEITRGGLAAALKTRLGYPLDRLLDELAPETLEVPSGNRIRIQYEIGQPPVLAVRLQELFGWTATPRIAGGRVPLLLHLLSPAFRPVQITHDLASFWRSAYFEVRKDLRAQYPKHAWPEDPLTAKAVAKGRRHRS